MEFSGERFRRAREAAGLTRANAAHDLGVVASTLQEYERGREPKVGTAVAAARLFGVPLEQFFRHAPDADTSVDGDVRNHGRSPANTKPTGADAGERLTATVGSHDGA